MDFEDFRGHAHSFSDWMADYLGSVETYPVRSQVRPGEILDKIPLACPELGEPMVEIFDDFQKTILPGITHWQHPKFFAYFNGNSSPPSVLAEMLTATLAAQCMLWETSPAATELEQRMMEWLRDLLGLPVSFVGSIQDSGSTSNLLAIIAACDKATKGRASREGLAGGPPLIVYASEEAHSSVEKGARIAGLGSANVRKIAVRDRLEDESTMRLDPLRTAVSALGLGLRRTGLTKGLNPSDRAGGAHPKPHRRRTARGALLNLGHDTATKVAG